MRRSSYRVGFHAAVALCALSACASFEEGVRPDSSGGATSEGGTSSVGGSLPWPMGGASPGGAGAGAVAGLGGVSGMGGTAGLGGAAGGAGTSVGGAAGSAGTSVGGAAGSAGTSAGGAAGAGGAGMGGGAGSMGGGGGVGGTGGSSWRRYELQLGSTVWTNTALDQVWVGANAPPATGILAATELEYFDELLVFADDGFAYRRAAGVWQPRESIAASWPELTNPIQSLYHLPDRDDSTVEGLTFTVKPNAVLYRYLGGGAKTYEATVTLQDEPNGAPHATRTGLSVFTLSDVALSTTSADWWVTYLPFDDGNVYRVNALPAWSGGPASTSEHFAFSTAPALGSRLAAYYDRSGDRIVVIGP